MSGYFGGGSDGPGKNLSSHDAARLADEVIALVDGAVGKSWYDEVDGNRIDLALARLCLLRRARAGEHGSVGAGDEAVRVALAAADHEAVVWLATRVVSFMDEQGFPDLIPGARQFE